MCRLVSGAVSLSKKYVYAGFTSSVRSVCLVYNCAPFDSEFESLARGFCSCEMWLSGQGIPRKNVSIPVLLLLFGRRAW